MSDRIVLCRCGRILADRLDPVKLERALTAPMRVAVPVPMPMAAPAPAPPRAIAPAPEGSAPVDAPPISLWAQHPALESLAMACLPEGCARVVQASREAGGRVTVLACGEAMHGRTFRDALAGAGLDAGGLRLVDVRSEAWRHALPDRALEGVIALARASTNPADRRAAPLSRRVLVVGAGIPALEIARILMHSGIEVVLIDRRQAGPPSPAADVPGAPGAVVPVRWNTRLIGASRIADGLIAHLDAEGKRSQERVGAVILAVGTREVDDSRGVMLPWPRPAGIVDRVAFGAMLDQDVHATAGAKRPGVIVLAGPLDSSVEPLALLAVRAADRYEDASVWLIHPDPIREAARAVGAASLSGRLVVVRGHLTKVVVAGEDLEIEAFDLDLGKGVAMGADLVVLQRSEVPDPELVPLASVLGFHLSGEGTIPDSGALDPTATAAGGVFVASGHAPMGPVESALRAKAAAAACIAYLASDGV